MIPQAHLSRPPEIQSKSDKDQTLTLDQIHVDEAMHPRAEINMDAVEDYAARMKAGDTFPRLIAFFDGEQYWMADGFHRFAAARIAGYKTFPVTIKRGTKRDALLYGFTANDKHGLRRTRADKRHDVEIMLADEEWGKWSNHEIARRCAVSEELVGKIRDSHLPKSDSENRTYTDKHGTTTTMHTENIGRLKAALASDDPVKAIPKALPPEPKPEREPDLTPRYGKLGDLSPDAAVSGSDDAYEQAVQAEFARQKAANKEKFHWACPCGCGDWSYPMRLEQLPVFTARPRR